MPPVRITSSATGPQITVNTLIKDPRLVPERILKLADEKFVADKLLRNAGNAPGGAVQVFESPPLYAENDPEIVAEFAEIPVAHTQVGEPELVPTVKRGLAVVVSEEMRRRNRMDLVNKQIRQVVNSVVRSIDGTFIDALLAAIDAGNQVASTADWDAGTGTTIRGDIAEAKQAIVDHKRGFNPDTLLISPTVATILETAPEVNEVFVGNVASSRPALAGQLPPRLSGLQPVVSYSVPDTSAYVLESGVAGGIADERPLSSTELYLWKPEAETYRSDTTRQSAVFIDEPLAIAEITGITT